MQLRKTVRMLCGGGEEQLKGEVRGDVWEPGDHKRRRRDFYSMREESDSRN